MARAGVMVDRAPAPQVGATVVPRAVLIQQAAEELQENHDCTHQAYRYLAENHSWGSHVRELLADTAPIPIRV